MNSELPNSMVRSFATRSSEAHRLASFAAAGYNTETGEGWFDPLDPRIVQLLRQPREVEMEYMAARGLGVHSQTVYGTTSFGWVILIMSGCLFAHEIADRARFFVPSRERVVGLLRKPVVNRAGQTVVV